MKSTTGFRFIFWGKVCGVLFVALLLSGSVPAVAQHDMSKMPGMSRPKPKAKSRATTRKKRRTAKHKRSAKKQQIGSRPGMNMPAQPSSSPKPSSKAQPSPQRMPKDMPGMPMPAASPSPTAQASPAQMEMKMPMTTPSPAVSPAKTEMNMPGMQPPTASPNSQSSPDQKMNMPRPAASASPGPTGDMKAMEGMPAKSSMNMGPLLVMSGNEMSIRVGSTSTGNVMLMGAIGSGTTWQPSSGPMYMYYKVAGDWLLMFHYNVVAGVNRQGGPRGVTKAESANWFMPMAYHKLGEGTVQLRGMFSFEPFTFPPGGSPLLFQTGETYRGQPLIDRQHPHDLIMELSAQYTLALGEHGTWFTYAGYPGEPALGPVAFMHRMSASENSSAPLAHHLQDSTHISFGVLTSGFTYRWLKLEGSIFNGREPDENRYNLDGHKWNSRSARVSIMPNPNLSIQASYGFLRSPEGQEPDTDIRRATASVQYNKPLDHGNWASAFIWGRNHTSRPAETHNLNGYTLESTVNFRDKNYLYTRLELVDKNELLRASDRALLRIKGDHASFRIGAYTFGGARDLWNDNKVSFAIGSDLTFYSKPAVLDQIYGANPVSWKLFLRLRPTKMDMSMHGTHKHSDAENTPARP